MNESEADYKVLGGFPFEYEGTSVTKSWGSFQYSQETKSGYRICLLREEDKRLFTLSLTQEEGECGSGYTTASWGRWKLEERDDRALIEKVPIEDRSLYLHPNQDDQADIYTDLFSVSEDGGDSYYPSGYWQVKAAMWKDKEESKREEEDGEGGSRTLPPPGATLIGARSSLRYERVYQPVEEIEACIYRGQDVYYEVSDGVTRAYKEPRPYNLIPSSPLPESGGIPPLEAFKPTQRHPSAPLVHLVHGSSACGKSTLFLDREGVYETDAHEGLTWECLTARVIIIGNKNGLTPEEVIKYFRHHSLSPIFISVEFKRLS